MAKYWNIYEWLSWLTMAYNSQRWKGGNLYCGRHSICLPISKYLYFLISNKRSILFRAAIHPATFSCFPGSLSFGSRCLPKGRGSTLLCLCFAAWNLAVMVRALADILNYENQQQLRDTRSKNWKKSRSSMTLWSYYT